MFFCKLNKLMKKFFLELKSWQPLQSNKLVSGSVLEFKRQTWGDREANRCIGYQIHELSMPLKKKSHFHCISIILTNAYILHNFFTLITDHFLLDFLLRFNVFLTGFLKGEKRARRERRNGSCFDPQFPYSGESVAHF